jgi:hypothetical protein
MSAQISFLEGFAWAVPEAFAQAVAECWFSRGDMLYDSPKAYEGPWGEARKHFRYALQVRLCSASTPASIGAGPADVFNQNWACPVEVDLTLVQSGETRAIKTTQGHLYTLLWKGMPSSGDWDTRAIRKPLRTAEADKALESVAEKCRELAGARDRISFLMAHDPTNPISAEKAKTVRQVLQSTFSCSEKSLLPEAVNAPSFADYAPTVRFEIFSVKGDRDAIHDALKSVLYVPTKNKKTDRESFKLRAHGLLLPVE